MKNPIKSLVNIALNKHKLVYTIGDSHSEYSFKKIHYVKTGNIGPITMHRVGRDKMDFSKINYVWGKPYVIPRNAYIVFCFGEIDVRCHINQQVKKASRSEDEVITTLVENYFKVILAHKKKFEHIIIMGVVPTSKDEKKYRNPELPVAGSDTDRTRYTKKINLKLKTLCYTNHVFFLDTSGYADKHGLLTRSLSDGAIHISDPKFIRTELDRILESS